MREKLIDTSILISMVCIIIMTVHLVVDDAPVVNSNYPPPVTEWTTTDNIKCQGWPIATDRWFFRCNDGNYGTATSGKLFRTLKSMP